MFGGTVWGQPVIVGNYYAFRKHTFTGERARSPVPPSTGERSRSPHHPAIGERSRSPHHPATGEFTRSPPPSSTGALLCSHRAFTGVCTEYLAELFSHEIANRGALFSQVGSPAGSALFSQGGPS
jgi:hypothetical protein